VKHKLLLLALLLAQLQAQTDTTARMEQTGQANLPAQRIGANDLLAVSVYRASELTRTVRVDQDGTVTLPLLKAPITAAGLLPRELETKIAAALKNEGILVAPIVNVTVAEYYSRPISVAGAVRKPITFQANGEIKLLEALTRAEGLSPEAGEEILISQSKSELIRRVPAKALINGSDPSLNLTLSGGEEIRVPEAGKIFVVGNVMKPGSFTVKDSTEPSLMKMLALAEGLAPFHSKQAFLYRDQKESPIELDKILNRKSPDIKLQAGDILYIPDNKGRRIGMAALEKALLFGSTAGATALVWRR